MCFHPCETNKKQRYSLRKFRMKTPLPSCLVSIMGSNIAQIIQFVNGFFQVSTSISACLYKYAPGESRTMSDEAALLRGT